MCAVTASFQYLAAVTHAVVVRFSEDPDIVRDLDHLEEDLEENASGVSSDPLACVREGSLGHVVLRMPMMQELCLSQRKALPR